MKEIQLTRGKVAIVDDWNFDVLSKYNWTAEIRRQRWYAKCVVNNRSVYMHRVIMNTPTNLEVDHKDLDGLNNRESNLRNVTRSVNAQNQRSKGRYVGVYFDKRDKRIFSAICVNYKTIYLGSFKTRYEAAEAYNEAAIKYFGEFAKVNDLSYEELN